jgi:hypothetical protein
MGDVQVSQVDQPRKEKFKGCGCKTTTLMQRDTLQSGENNRKGRTFGQGLQETSRKDLRRTTTKVNGTEVGKSCKYLSHHSSTDVILDVLL